MNLMSDRKKKQQLLYTYGTFIMNGMLALSIGALLPFVRDARGLDYALCGLIVSLHSVGNLFSSFMSGTLPVFIGRKKTILLFNAFFAISYLMIIFAKSDWLIALAFFLTGLARGATSNSGNAVINNLAPGKAGILNGLHAMFSIGAFLFPILLMGLTRSNTDGWLYACGFMVIMGVISWILYYRIPVENERLKKQESDGNFGFFREPFFYLCTLTLFFYLCAEQGVIGWMITYFQDTGLLSASLAQVTASILWIMILAGRLTTAWLSAKVKKEHLLLAMGIGIVLFFLLLLQAKSTPLIVFGIMGFGYSMAGIYPTTLSFAGLTIQKYPIGWSFMLTIASVGSIIMPTIIGKIAESAGIFYGMSSVVAVVFIDLACIIALVWYVKKVHMHET